MPPRYTFLLCYCTLLDSTPQNGLGEPIFVLKGREVHVSGAASNNFFQVGENKVRVEKLLDLNDQFIIAMTLFSPQREGQMGSLNHQPKTSACFASS